MEPGTMCSSTRLYDLVCTSAIVIWCHIGCDEFYEGFCRTCSFGGMDVMISFYWKGWLRKFFASFWFLFTTSILKLLLIFADGQWGSMKTNNEQVRLGKTEARSYWWQSGSLSLSKCNQLQGTCVVKCAIRSQKPLRTFGILWEWKKDRTPAHPCKGGGRIPVTGWLSNRKSATQCLAGSWIM